MFETKGLKYISTPRNQNQRGGGVGIVADTTKGALRKIEVPIPFKLEIVWGLFRPRDTCHYKDIIVVSFYLPPKTKKKPKMFDHISVTLHQLLYKYPAAGILIGADRNEFDISPLLSITPRLVQMVNQPTRGNKILDVLISNMSNLYACVEIHPPVVPDIAGHSPSDHSVPVAYPLSDQSLESSRSYKVKKYRPLPQSGINDLGKRSGVFLEEMVLPLKWFLLSKTFCHKKLILFFQLKVSKFLTLIYLFLLTI